MVDTTSPPLERFDAGQPIGFEPHEEGRFERLTTDHEKDREIASSDVVMFQSLRQPRNPESSRTPDLAGVSLRGAIGADVMPWVDFKGKAKPRLEDGT